MQVVLLGNAKTLGRRGQIVNVDDGYTRNFILPKKLGVEANPKNLNDLKFKKTSNDRIVTEQLAAAKELGTKPDESPITLAIKAGEGGRTFGFVSSKEIGKATEDQLGINTGKKKIMLNDPIRSTGSLKMPIKLHKETTARPAAKVAEA